MVSCVVCAITLKRGETGSITCLSCNGIFHIQCVKINQDDIDYLNSIKKNWSCSNCTKKPEKDSKSDTQSDNISSPDVKLILKQLNLLKFEQSKLINLVNKQTAKLDAFERKFTEVFSQLATIKDDNILLHNNLNSLTARLEAIELNRSTPDEDSFSDFVDRQARSKNVILFNVPDAPDDSNNSDSSTVDLIFTKLALDIKPITIQRLGKFDGKIRPLKISLASASDVFKTLGSSRKLKSDQIFNAVRITSDKTPKQRLYFQNLRKELDMRRSDGESNLTIKYVKGIPSIVNSAVQKN
ncbi:unnamed protein product [Macrosiphum euphorbiae]|uniref:PHD-type domain-containing protein n=1 Tax=Macrosiphum euphorbiae TaxID=13131 RepID=A0AAV0YDV1_9HEMI|nr:unnamed protein product [Macrosiphum euphorbiae]